MFRLIIFEFVKKLLFEKYEFIKISLNLGLNEKSEFFLEIKKLKGKDSWLDEVKLVCLNFDVSFDILKDKYGLFF